MIQVFKKTWSRNKKAIKKVIMLSKSQGEEQEINFQS